ncbi:hypothetical protein B6E66_23925 [Streptomyces maremycinicus]|nr:hypothetical protein B6E66_23925 [Streptomyces sp. B9173]
MSLLLLIYLDRFTHNLRPLAIADVGRAGEQVIARAVTHARSTATPDGAPTTGPTTGSVTASGPNAALSSRRCTYPAWSRSWPTTAIQVLNHVEAFLHTVGRAGTRAPYELADDRGRLCLVPAGRPWENYLELAVAR